ncbi:endopeptidase [Coprinopsis sp. MPI-PUGE-AT-0042]|nr:endopeptidase [Coprinopsis sp. MPI-PUGE-AT-0042]
MHTSRFHLFSAPCLLSLAITLACFICNVCASPTASPQAHHPTRQWTRQSMTLHKEPIKRSTEDWGQWAKNHKLSLEAKYGGGKYQKRATGTNYLTNQNADSSYFGTLAIGTPPTSYNLILDTGSADLWVAGSECSTGCSNVPLFDPSSSSTFQNESSAFSITYGSGQAIGFLAQDAVQMAGFEVSNQVFAVCEQVSDGLLTTPVSGLLGLAFASIASTRATPFWETLVENGAWDEPVMAFHLTRFLNVSTAATLEPGGSFSMGFINSSLYTGDIDYVNLEGEPAYWSLPLSGITVQGNEVTAPTGSEALAAIDTGTTLVGGPSQFIAAIYDQIPGSQPGSGNFENYYTYPCDTDVTVSLNFGGNKSWTIVPADFELTRLTRDTCLGAFFEITTRGSAPSWIVGDTFLKNVYSVFRYDPPSVGFAQLSSEALSINGDTAIPVPSATVGSSPASVSASLRGSNSGAKRQASLGWGDGALALAASVVFAFMGLV